MPSCHHASLTSPRLSTPHLSPVCPPRIHSPRSFPEGRGFARPPCTVGRKRRLRNPRGHGVGIAGLKFPGVTETSLAVGITHPHSGVLQPPLPGWKAGTYAVRRGSVAWRAIREISGAEMGQNIAVRGRPQGHHLLQATGLAAARASLNQGRRLRTSLAGAARRGVFCRLYTATRNAGGRCPPAQFTGMTSGKLHTVPGFAPESFKP